MTVEDDEIVDRLRGFLEVGATPPRDMEERITQRLAERRGAWQVRGRHAVHSDRTLGQRGRRTWMLELGLGLGLGAAAVTVLIVLMHLTLRPSTGPAARQPAASQSPVLPLVLQSAQPCAGQVQTISGAGTWVLSASGLHANGGPGATWEDITPTGVKRDSSGFCRLNGNQAWFASVVSTDQLGDSTQIGVWRTVDGGRSWQRAGDVRGGLEEAHGAGELQFVDPKHGWLMVPVGGHAHGAVLFATEDGGLSWQQRAAGRPFSAGLLDFTTPSSGWLAFSGGAAGGEGLYHSGDGGRSWVVATSPFFAAETTGCVPQFVDLQFFGPRTGVVATDPTCGVSDLVVWTTDDAARSWHRASQTLDGSCGFYALNQTTWAALSCSQTDGHVAAIKWTFDHGLRWTPIQVVGLRSVEDALTFADSHDVWLIGWPTSNAQKPTLYFSPDSGHTWVAQGGGT